jgi:hypothetical protein
MKHQLTELADQRCRLIKKIDLQRSDVTDIARHLQNPVKIIDAGLNAAHFAQRHPALVAGTFAVVLTFWTKGIPSLKYLISPILRFAFDRMLPVTRATNPPPLELNSEAQN